MIRDVIVIIAMSICMTYIFLSVIDVQKKSYKALTKVEKIMDMKNEIE